ncbi:MAG: hypothetical protein WC683_02685 [bacterium]
MAKTKEWLKQVDAAVLRSLVKEYEEDKAKCPQGGRLGRTSARWLTHSTALSLAQVRGSIKRLAAAGEVALGRRGEVRFYPQEERAEDAKEQAEYEALKRRVDGLRDGLRDRGFEAYADSYRDGGWLRISPEAAQRFLEMVHATGASGTWKPGQDDSDD